MLGPPEKLFSMSWPRGSASSFVLPLLNRSMGFRIQHKLYRWFYWQIHLCEIDALSATSTHPATISPLLWVKLTLYYHFRVLPHLEHTLFFKIQHPEWMLKFCIRMLAASKKNDAMKLYLPRPTQNHPSPQQESELQHSLRCLCLGLFWKKISSRDNFVGLPQDCGNHR